MRLPLCLVLMWVFLEHRAQTPPLQADRPDQTETPFLVPKRHFQAETGFVFESDDATKVIVHPSLLLKYGALDNVELRLITETQTVKHISEEEGYLGVHPIEAGLKVKLFEQRKARPEAALIGHAGIPWLASEQFQPDYATFNFRFTFQHTIADWMSLGYNAGMEWDGESPEPAFIYTLTTGFSITGKLGAYAEVYGFIPQKSASQHSADGGLTFLAKTNLLLDLSGGVGITANAPDYFVGCGVSFRLPD
ncbi:MAG TPA: transporter [Chitinophagales bacterium]|nr:transporter [Chitinophagales bacterium]